MRKRKTLVFIVQL